jgi:hypothetical protein
MRISVRNGSRARFSTASPIMFISWRVESRTGAVAWGRLANTPFPVTGSPEAIARLRFPQNVACGFPAPRSSTVGSQHREALQGPIGKMQFRSR